MADNLMSDQRHTELMKAAEACIGLMNVGVRPNPALAKIADDHHMNEKEVSLVSHAVNNSKQLAHLQTTSPEKREEEFPITDAEEVKVIRTQPLTNAEDDPGDRYGPQDEKGETTKQKYHENDALDIKEELDKEAAASYSENSDFRLQPSQPDAVSTLRSAWGLEKGVPKLAEYEDPNPFAKLDYYRIGVEEARLKYAAARDQAISAINSLSESFRRVDAPRFAEFEKAAAATGVSRRTLDFIYEAGRLEKFGEERADLTQKLASPLYITSKTNEYVQKSVCADNFLKEAIDASAALSVIKKRAEAASPKIAGDTPTGVPGDIFKIDLDPQPAEEALSRAPSEFLGLGEDPVEGIRGIAGIGEAEKDKKEPRLSQEATQEMANFEARAVLEELMEDPVVGGYSMPEVVEAYNAAMSVNPNFGKAALTSYMRQHLATEGAVPLDLQLRASPRTPAGVGGD